MTAPGGIHGYAGWRDGAAYCTCGRTFESVQALDSHVRAALAAAVGGDTE